MEQVWISLGSNLGDRLAHLQRAVAALRLLAPVAALSDVYETEPVGYTEQPLFLNAVLGLQLHHTAQSPDAPLHLLDSLLAIERAFGRFRSATDSVAKGPRVLDLDILLYGSRVLETPAITIPHPEMHRRRFVLEPLAQVAPEVEHPILRRSALQLLQELPADGPTVRRLDALPALSKV
jgi:2-amino-4-hydroxy-6-hydroxymethyldihydropteridine diphosphokinase